MARSGAGVAVGKEWQDVWEAVVSGQSQLQYPHIPADTPFLVPSGKCHLSYLSQVQCPRRERDSGIVDSSLSPSLCQARTK